MSELRRFAGKWLRCLVYIILARLKDEEDMSG